MIKKNSNTFYFRCEACNAQLDEFQQLHGLCTDCKSSVFYQNNVWDKNTTYYEIYRMWNPPMGDISEFFEDVENEYQGGYSE